MTFKVLMNEFKVIHRSVVHSAASNGVSTNKQANNTVVTKAPTKEKGESLGDVYLYKSNDTVEQGLPLPSINTSNLLGRMFMNDPNENGEQVRAKIELAEPLGRTTPDGKQELFRFCARVREKSFKNIMAYNKMLEWCDRDLDKDDFFRIKGILGHWREKNAGRGHAGLVQWADKTVTWNDLSTTFQDNPISVSL